MKQIYTAAKTRFNLCLYGLAVILSLACNTASAQSCPMNNVTQVSAYPNTFYPANQATVAVGSTSIALAASTYGSNPIVVGDILLVVQMQGAQINSSNNSAYGNGGTTGSGYLNNGSMVAGNMEYVVAANNVSLSGGTLNIASGLVNSYQNTAFAADGQYTYQVIRVPVYYSVQLTGAIVAPRWNGTSGGAVVLYATNNIDMNGFLVDASGLGFRGGGGRAFTGAGSGSVTDYLTLATSNANGGKGEGIAGTPKYLNNNNAFLDVSSYEGYPNGSYGRGAPGNAGGGGTDGNPANNNNENTGGGGGGNGGTGGNGGNAWSSGATSGGKPGTIFNQASPKRLVMGGGGGAGTTNDATGNPGGGFASSGSAGGGLVIVIAKTFSGNGQIRANGSAANSTVKNDGSGGGGAGGSVLILATSGGSISNITASANGGNGGTNQLFTIDSHGPGGGGGGGIIYSNVSLNAASSANGGAAGFTSKNTTNYGATSGTVGILSQSITQAQTAKFPISCVTLATSFIDVTAEQQNGPVAVSWSVSNEVNTQKYMVEKSLDGNSFSAIGSVTRKTSGTSTNEYEYSDNNSAISGGILYYRIREVEVSGEFVYSKVVTVHVNGLVGKLSVYPNPVRTTATVSFVSAAEGMVSLRLFDMKGSVVKQQQYPVNAGQNNVLLDNMQGIPNGLYILQYSDGQKPEQIKLIVNH